MQGLLDGLPGGSLTGGAAANQQKGVSAIADGGVHAEAAIGLDADGCPDDQLVALLDAQRVEARKIA